MRTHIAEVDFECTTGSECILFGTLRDGEHNGNESAALGGYENHELESILIKAEILPQGS